MAIARLYAGSNMAPISIKTAGQIAYKLWWQVPSKAPPNERRNSTRKRLPDSG